MTDGEIIDVWELGAREPHRNVGKNIYIFLGIFIPLVENNHNTFWGLTKLSPVRSSEKDLGCWVHFLYIPWAEQGLIGWTNSKLQTENWII